MEKQTKTALPRGVDPYTPLCGRWDYVLFRSDTEEGSVLLSQSRDHSLFCGDDFWKSIRLSEKGLADLREAVASQSACLVASPLGLGLLSARYDVWMGVMLYLHLSDDPLETELYRRALPKNLPMVWDVPEKLRKRQYAEANEKTIQRIDELKALFVNADINLRPNDQDRLPLLSVRNFLVTAAEHTGCILYMKENDENREVICPASRIAELLVFFAVAWLKDMTEGGTVSCSVSADPCGDEPYLTVDFAATVGAVLKNGALRSLDHMICKAALNSVTVQATADPVTETGDNLYLLAIHMSFNRHPAMEPPGGLKTRYLLNYDD